MGYLFCIFVGCVVGGLGVWLLVMALVESWKKREQAAVLLSKSADDKLASAAEKQSQLQSKSAALDKRVRDFEARVITFEELRAENNLLKRDLQNIDIMTHKLQLDGEIRQKAMEQIATRSDALAKRYLKETVKSVISAIGPSNFTNCKTRLVEVIARCREIGFTVSAGEESALLGSLREEFEKAVRAAFEREEQERIKAQIREEEKVKREIDRELKQLEREQQAIRVALEQAMRAAEGKHSVEVEQLKARLAEAEEKSKRAISMAQQTKAGHVYIISNIGTFGRDIFKVGMTRRIKPHERVDELGSASVPFPFDVHMMISTPNAPALENTLHRALRKQRVNKANPRKEFFRTTISAIYEIVKEAHGDVDYVADPAALEYNQSLTMPEADEEFILDVYSRVESDQFAEGDLD
jgi:hypothetical protein